MLKQVLATTLFTIATTFSLVATDKDAKLDVKKEEVKKEEVKHVEKTTVEKTTEKVHHTGDKDTPPSATHQAPTNEDLNKDNKEGLKQSVGEKHEDKNAKDNKKEEPKK